MNGDGITFRAIAEEEFPRFVWTAGTAFGEDMDRERLDIYRGALELNRTFAAFDGDRMVGTLAVLSLELTLPGGGRLPTGGVSWVGVLPTHRRRGVLTRLMWRALRDSEQRGEALSALNASEAVIYGRYGYGPATFHASYDIDTLRAFPPTPPATDEGELRQLEPEEASAIIPAVYERAGRARPGTLSRSSGWWRDYLADSPQDREGAGALSFIVHFGAGGEPDGYASYRVKESWERWLPNNSLIAVELVAEKSEVRERLFRALLSMDLIRTVTLRLAPVDGPLRWLLGDLRQLRTNFVADELWLRLLDVPRALAARSYNLPGRLVIDLQDQLFPVKSGRYLLETEGDGRAEVSPTQEPEDVALDASALGSAYLGGVSFETLRQAGRLEERRPGACRRADLMFREEPPPFSGTEF